MAATGSGVALRILTTGAVIFCAAPSVMIGG
jgi:hypothetical protein